VRKKPADFKRELKPLDNERVKAFRSFLLQRFEDTISGILGEKTKNALLDRLEKSTGLKGDELIGQTDMLMRSLKEIFGESALVLERMMAKQICRELGLGIPPQDFEAAVEVAEQAYMKVTPKLLVSR